jgi:hypothetical protein
MTVLLVQKRYNSAFGAWELPTGFIHALRRCKFQKFYPFSLPLIKLLSCCIFPVAIIAVTGTTKL